MEEKEKRERDKIARPGREREDVSTDTSDKKKRDGGKGGTSALCSRQRSEGSTSSQQAVRTACTVSVLRLHRLGVARFAPLRRW